MEPARRILVIGYGNPGRMDDGLGPACAAAIEARHIPGVDVDVDYQLNVEHAADAARHAAVVFADAAVEGPAPFDWRPIEARPVEGMGTHTLGPGAVLALARDIFRAEPRGYALAIRGRRFSEFGERLSDEARRHLDAAVEFLDSWLRRIAAGAETNDAAAADPNPMETAR